RRVSPYRLVGAPCDWPADTPNALVWRSQTEPRPGAALALLAALPQGVLAATAGTRTAAALAREVLRDHRYQTVVSTPRAPGWVLTLPILGAAPPLVSLALAVLVVLLALWILHQVGTRARTVEDVGETPAASAAPFCHASLADAQRIAGEGRYAEAAH